MLIKKRVNLPVKERNNFVIPLLYCYNIVNINIVINFSLSQIPEKLGKTGKTAFFYNTFLIFV